MRAPPLSKPRPLFSFSNNSACCSPGVLQGAALRAFYLPGDAQDYQLQEIGGEQRLRGDGGEAWVLRAKGRDAEVVQVFVGWPR